LDDDENDESPTPDGQYDNNAASSVYGTLTPAMPSSGTADNTSAEADGAGEAADGVAA
jgi:hypothetical protein